MNYTITDLIALLEKGNNLHHSANIVWGENRSYFEGWLQCTGESVDLRNETAENWCEEWYEQEMNYFECSPFLPEDEPIKSGDYNGSPIRTHDYSSCYIYIRVNLPENRKRGDVYSEEEIHKMVEILSYGEDEPGYGFNYFNLPDE